MRACCTSGADRHLPFLLSLLLPAVLVRTARGWLPVSRPRPAVISILKVVTAFTLAHSITLSLAALDVVRLPSRLTESVIAASIVLAALNNIFPVVTESRARIAFTFGLLHGFGFASVLADMGLPQGSRLLSLVAFNLGIEVGQLAVVLAVMPVVYGLAAGRRARSLSLRHAVGVGCDRRAGDGLADPAGVVPDGRGRGRRGTSGGAATQPQAQDRGILATGGRLVVAATGAHLLEAQRLVQADRNRVGGAHFQEGLDHAGILRQGQQVADQHPAHAAAASRLSRTHRFRMWASPAPMLMTA